MKIGPTPYIIEFIMKNQIFNHIFEGTTKPTTAQVGNDENPYLTHPLCLPCDQRSKR